MLLFFKFLFVVFISPFFALQFPELKRSSISVVQILNEYFISVSFDCYLFMLSYETVIPELLSHAVIPLLLDASMAWVR